MPSQLPSSGIRELDEFCFKEVDILNQVYGLRPTFGFLDDADAANAFAIDTSTDTQRPDGIVLFGVSLAHQADPQNNAGGKLKIAAIMAHEWGHLYQYKQKFADSWGVRFELVADYMAGWHIAKTKSDSETVLAGAAELFRSIGDNLFTSEDHHGTPRQRSEVFMSGAGFTRGGPGGREETVEGAFQRGIGLVRWRR